MSNAAVAPREGCPQHSIDHRIEKIRFRRSALDNPQAALEHSRLFSFALIANLFSLHHHAKQIVHDDLKHVQRQVMKCRLDVQRFHKESTTKYEKIPISVSQRDD